ncbi:WD40-repeat-containing domain protein [Trametes gibbosa]|nr:WD40-repeat-containing domain protein [Trametes gibbosa]
MPLGVTADFEEDIAKDEEELRLESFLFGTGDTQAGPSGEYDPLIDDVEYYGVSNEFQNVMDEELFAVDELTVKSASDAASKPMLPKHNTSHKAPAWTDADDTTLHVSLTSDKRRRKMRDALVEDSVSGRDYERRLRRQFEKINPTPEWATNARKRLHVTASKRRRSAESSGSDAEELEDPDIALDSLLSGTGSVLTRRKAKIISHGTLSIERLRDANLSAKAEGEVKAVQFHPSPQVPVLLTAGLDRRLRLFTVDGHTNPHLQTIHIPDLPLTKAVFHPNGTSVLLTGPRPFYYTYDLQTGTAQRSPRGLWGTTFASTRATQEGSMDICAFDSTGSVLAIAGRRGHVHLVDWRAGGGQVVGSLKMNSGVRSLWWSGEELLTLGEDSEVYVWDVGQRRCLRRWKDDGGYGSQLLACDRSGKYLATGSRMGIVNVYGSDAASSGAERPKPLKALGNLTTSITSLRFNHDSQLLAMASNVKKDQMRMVHLPSLTAFSNWPTSSTPLGHVTSIDFSAGSEYVAVGNNRGRVLLYHLKDFSAL